MANSMSPLRRLFSLTAVAGMFAFPSSATILFNYPDFSSAAGLTLAGSAGLAVTSDGPVLRVTPAAFSQHGAAYSTAAVPLGAGDTFSTTFQFRFTNPGGTVNSPADGITFVLAASPSGLGSGGGGLGYQGVPNSVAIELDTFFNSGVDINGNHVAIDTGGVLTNSHSTSPYGATFCDFGHGNMKTGCFANGDLWSATIGYDGTNLSATVWDMSGPFSSGAPFVVYSSLPLDIAGALGTSTAFVGFTGGTGSGFENQDILSWQFANTTVLGPGTTPEPATFVLLGAGLAGLGLLKYRRSAR